jgi:hypothetical protein
MTAATVGHRPVKVLSIGYEELGRIALKRAVRLLSLNKAVVEEADPSGRFLRHAGGELWPLPLVIRLTRFFKLPFDDFYGAAPLSRRGVMLRDGYKCAYCGGRASTIDHIHPQSRGGEDSWMNWVAACFRCNNLKDNRTPKEAGMTLLFPPRVPTRLELRQAANK